MAQLKEAPTPKIVKPPTPNIMTKKVSPPKDEFIANVRGSLMPASVTAQYTPAAQAILSQVPVVTSTALQGKPATAQTGLGGRGGGSRLTPATPSLAAAYRPGTFGGLGTILVNPNTVQGKYGDYSHIIQHEANHALDAAYGITGQGNTFSNTVANLFGFTPSSAFKTALGNATLPATLSGFQGSGGRNVGYASGSTAFEAYAELGATKPSNIPASLQQFYPQFNPLLFGGPRW